jgi:hypothetical protein
MNKKIILLTLASSLLLAGCNPSSASSAASSAASSSSEQPTTSQPASSSTDPEAKYQIAVDEFADYFTSLSNVTVTEKSSYWSDAHIISYDGALGQRQTKASDGTLKTGYYMKATDSRVVIASVGSDASGKTTYRAQDVYENSVSYHFTSMWQFYRMSFLSMLGVDSSISDADVAMTDAEFKSCVKAAFAKASYDSTSHNYIIPASSSSSGATAINLHFEGKKLLHYSGSLAVQGAVYAVEADFSEIGTTKITLPSEVLPYLTPIKVSFYSEDGQTLYSEQYVSYLHSCSTPAGLLPGKDPDAGDSEYSYAFDGWDKTITALTADVVVKPVFKKVANTTLYTIDSSTGVMNFKDAHEAVANTTIPAGVKEVNISYGFSRSYYYQMTFSDSVTSLVDPNVRATQILFSVSSGNTTFSTENKALYSADKKKLYSHFAGDEATSFTSNAATEEIEDKAFVANKNLLSVSLDDALTSLGAYAFSESGIESITLPSKLTTMGMSCFNSCVSLKSIALPDTLTSIPSYCFIGCRSLASVSWSTSLVSIGAFAFANNFKLASIGAFSSAFQSFGGNAFMSCLLTSVDLSKTALTSLASGLFSNNYYLSSILLPSTVKSIGRSTFEKTDLKTFTITKDMTLDTACFAGCAALVLTNENTTAYTLDSNNNLFSADGKTLLFAGNKEKLVVPSSVTNIAVGAASDKDVLKELDLSAVSASLSIGQNAFAGTTSLTKIDWPTSTSAIITFGSACFEAATSLTEVSLPACVTSIGESSFSGCVALTSVDLSASPLTSIGGNTFGNCLKLASVSFPAGLTSIGDMAFVYCESLESITLPETLTSIGYNAFAYNAVLKNVVIPASVTTIGPSAFSRDSALSAIYLKATSLPSGYSSGWNGSSAYYLYSENTPSENPGSYWHYVNNVPTVYPAA